MKKFDIEEFERNFIFMLFNQNLEITDFKGSVIYDGYLLLVIMVNDKILSVYDCRQKIEYKGVTTC